MASQSTVNINGIWFDCEYMQSENGVKIVTLGDVENMSQRGAYIKGTLQRAATEFFLCIPPGRKIVILTEVKDQPQENWPRKQVIKNTLAQTPKARTETSILSSKADQKKLLSAFFPKSARR